MATLNDGGYGAGRSRTRTGSGSSAGIQSDHSGDTHDETDNFDPDLDPGKRGRVSF